MNARQLGAFLLQENPWRKVIIDIGGFKVEVLDAELCTHEGEPAIELTPGPRDPDEDKQLAREIILKDD